MSTPQPQLNRRRVLLAAAVLPLACSAQTGTQTLTVSAAASLGDAMRELQPRFEATQPGISLRFNFAASGVLLQQIAQGAPVDVFASADTETLDNGLQRKLLLPASRREFATNRLVLVVPAQGGLPLQRLDDLTRADVRRIAIGKSPIVPAGRYALQALQAQRLAALLQPKLIPADSVRQVLDYVARGEVDAGFVYRSDVLALPDRVRVVQTLEEPVVRYPAAVVAASAQPVPAAAFVAFLVSPAAREVLVRWGFGPP